MTAPPAVPRLHVVTDDEVLARPGVLDRARAVLAAGGGAVALHVRGPRAPGRILLEVAARLVEEAAATGSRVLVNDRVDVARLAGADGAHLGERSLSVADARSLLEPGRLVGASAHGPEAVARWAADGPDYLFVGTIFPTPSHAGRTGVGVAGFVAAAAAAGNLPVLGIGGITPERAARLRAAGAAGVAVVRGVWAADDPGAAVAAYLNALTNDEETE